MKVERHRHVGIGNEASYAWERHGPVLALWDEGGTGSLSLTNDVEGVLARLRGAGALAGVRRIIYRDSEGRWDEIALDAGGAFAGFVLLGADSGEAAIGSIMAEEYERLAERLAAAVSPNRDTLVERARRAIAEKLVSIGIAGSPAGRVAILGAAYAAVDAIGQDRPEIRVRIDEADFRHLCAGEIVTLAAADGTQVKVILADIGANKMLSAVLKGTVPEVAPLFDREGC